MLGKKDKVEYMLLGGEKVEIVKLTPKKWKLVINSISTLPTMIVTVLQAPKDQVAEYLFHAFEMSQGEIVEAVHKVTGLEKEFLEDQVGLDEIIEYVVRVFKKNRLDQLGKNLQSLLSK